MNSENVRASEISQFQRTHCRIPSAAHGRRRSPGAGGEGSEEHTFMRYRFTWEDESCKGRVSYMCIYLMLLNCAL